MADDNVDDNVDDNCEIDERTYWNQRELARNGRVAWIILVLCLMIVALAA